MVTCFGGAGLQPANLLQTVCNLGPRKYDRFRKSQANSLTFQRILLLQTSISLLPSCGSTDLSGFSGGITWRNASMLADVKLCRSRMMGKLGRM